ncbi:MAG: ATP-binding protein [bacterium]
MSSTNLQKFRWLKERLPASSARRLVILTGARQTGKTTLVRAHYPDLRYINLDAPENRDFVRQTRTTAWARTVGHAVLDEAQKEPTVFEKVKFNFDEGDLHFTVLLGSSQILLLKKIRESLAGRAFLYELFPLMLSELASDRRAPQRPLLARLLESDKPAKLVETLPSCLLPQDEEAALSAMEFMLNWGGMPALITLNDSDKRQWLQSYGHTYLERDLGDLARLDDLNPFRELQRLAALRSGCILSFSELARDAALSTSTTRRYLEYLKLSYQTFLLPTYRRSLTSSVIKAPKLYWMDIGILRQLQGNWGAATGPLFETFVVSEIYKWLRTSAVDVEPTFYRTRSGLEVDLLLSTPAGLLGIEIKSAKQVAARDFRGLRSLADALGSTWAAGLLVTRGDAIHLLDSERKIWSVPAHRLLA